MAEDATLALARELIRACDEDLYKCAIEHGENPALLDDVVALLTPALLAAEGRAFLEASGIAVHVNDSAVSPDRTDGIKDTLFAYRNALRRRWATVEAKHARCGVCRAEFEKDDLVGVTACPSCGNTGVPESPAYDVRVTLNWHALRCLFIWAEGWSDRPGFDAASRAYLRKLVEIVSAARPEGAPALTLAGEIADVREATGLDIEVHRGPRPSACGLCGDPAGQPHDSCGCSCHTVHNYCPEPPRGSNA